MDFSDYYQRRRLQEHNRRIGQNRNSTLTVEDRVRELEETVDRLALLCRSMWDVLRRSTEHTDDDLMATFEQLDLEDGKADGRLQPPPKPCPHCERPNKTNRTSCLYCGAELEPSGGFDTL